MNRLRVSLSLLLLWLRMGIIGTSLSTALLVAGCYLASVFCYPDISACGVWRWMAGVVLAGYALTWLSVSLGRRRICRLEASNAWARLSETDPGDRLNLAGHSL